MNRNNKDGPRGKGVNENISRTVRISSKNTPEEVQRVIDKINQVPDNELHEFLDEDFMDGLDVVDAWDGDDDLGDDFHNRDDRDKDNRRNSRDRNRRDFRDSGRNNRDNRDRDRDRERGRRDERRREERRDPSKSSQDIERDKIRAKRINESKILAEKEKAIKHLLDSGTVVPPGTEVETIENEKQMDRDRDREHDRDRDRDREQRSHRSRDRRRSLERHRISPTRRRSHDRNRMSPLRRSPLVSNLRRSVDRHRKPSWEHPGSSERRERRSSLDRGRRRLDERDVRMVGRRSRSRERQRSRSQDRYRRRWSRSSGGRRNSPRRRTHSKSPDHRRKRTPFIDELARQFRENPIIPPESMNQGYMHPSLRGIQSQQQTSLLGPGPGLPQIPVPPQHFLPLQESLPPMNAGQSGGPPSYIPYDNLAPAGSSMSFDPLSMHSITQSDYTAGPVLYNQPNSVPIHTIQARPGFIPMTRSPQPVPAPPMDQSTLFHQQVSTQIQASPSPQPERMDPGLHLYSERSSSTYNEGLSSSRRDRLKTPEPPVISKSKQLERTSLSSLLEASVSAKDSSHPVLYPGFKPEILRHCELALRDLPDEDPRLKIKGRFFFDPSKDEPLNESSELISNSILLQKHSSKKLWYDAKEKVIEEIKPSVEVHQKYCQTDIKDFIDQCTQTEVEMIDESVQVHISEPKPREEKRPIMDRLDWNKPDLYDYNSKAREVNDLRWSLSNSSQKRWNRGVSPSSQDQDDRILLASPGRLSHQDHDSREYIHRIQSPIHHSDSYSLSRGPSRRSFSPRERHFSPDYRQDTYHENISEGSHEPSPIVLDEHDDIEIIEQDSFSHDPNWRGRNNKSFGQGTPVHKSRSTRGKHSSGRSFRGRGGSSSSYRGKY